MNDVTVRVNFNHFDIGCDHDAALKVPDILVKYFAPVGFTDDIDFTRMNNEIMQDSEMAEIVIQRRKEAANALAKELSDYLYNQMCKNDTLNGYRIVDIPSNNRPTK